MAAPYSSAAIVSYNTNPPADDGTQVASNQILWATIKTKLADPPKTLAELINTNVGTAFGKIIGGAGVSSTAVDYQVQGTDQGKLVRATASGITITTPDATSVLSPFVFGVLNNSSGTITLDGSGSQTIDGNATITLPASGGTLLFTDGTNWFTTGIQGTFVGKQLGYGDIINGTIAESNGSNATTYALKTLAGNDPSAADPVLVCFRNGTIGTGNYVYRTITAALSLVIPSTATMGASNGVAFKLWLVLFDDGGTMRLGAINCLSGTSIYPLGQLPLASSTTVSTGADNAHVFYTDAGVTTKAYVILGYASYESGLATAGSWNASPTRLQPYAHGVPLPGSVIQTQRTDTGTVATGTTVLPFDNTIPQNTEGDQYMTQAITPTSVANVLEIEAQGFFYNSGSGTQSAALFQDATAGALKAAAQTNSSVATNVFLLELKHRMLAGTASATTFKMRSGAAGAGTTTFNGTAGTQLFGGVCNSFMQAREIAA